MFVVLVYGLGIGMCSWYRHVFVVLAAVGAPEEHIDDGGQLLKQDR